MRSMTVISTMLMAVSPAIAATIEADSGASNVALDEVVVVATKRETSVRDVAADVTVLGAADLRATLSASLADAFRFVPGVGHESSGSRFGAEGLTVRGVGGNRIAIELDGVPLSDHFDIGNFSNATRGLTDTGLIGQIEVLRGPASAVYGSSAIGGVVAMQTLSPAHYENKGAMAGRASLLYRGLDDSQNIEASFLLRGQWVSLLVAGSVRDGAERQSAALDTADDRQDFHHDAGLVKLVGENRLGHDWQISVIRQSRDTTTEISSVLGSGRFASTTRLEGDDRHTTDLVSAEYRFGGGPFSEGLFRVFHADARIAQVSLDERAAARSPASIERQFFFEQRLRGAELNLWRDTEMAGWSHRFGVGLEFTESRTEELRDALSTSLVDGSETTNILGESFPLRDFPITQEQEFGAYISDQLSRGPLSLMLALRADKNRLSPASDEIYAADNPSTSVITLSEADLSPKLGAIYRAGDNLDLYLQYAHGFRAPPFEDANIGLDIPLFNIRAIPNPELRSEASDGWELGMRWQGERSRMQLGAFQTSYTDFIESKVRIGIDPQSGRLLFQSINIGEAEIRGLEASWTQDLSPVLPGLSLEASAYWAEGENKEDGLPLNSVGPAEAVIGAYWRSADDRTEIRVLLTATERWSGRDESAGELFEPPGHGVIDLFLAHSISDNLTLRAGIGNVDNRLYWRWSEVRGLAPDDALLPTLAQSGRNYSIGLQWDW
ncbi:MAG: TonB-dependent receptor [Woeseiaceae bacterium]|nr:TonB-dependent receptor [Woeseiaceae bacterium]